MQKKPTFLVTGATGFIGQYTCRAIRNDFPDARIVGQTRDCAKVDLLKKMNVEPLVADLNDREALSDILLQSEYVFHLAANALFSAKGDLSRDNIKPLEVFCDLLKDSQNLKRLVFTSTVGVLDRKSDDLCEKSLDDDSTPSPTSNYGRSKLSAEQVVMLSNLPWTIIRPTWVYGPGMRSNSHLAFFIDLALKGSLIARFRFPGRAAVIHAQDLAEAMLAASQSSECLNRRLLICEEEPVEIGLTMKRALAASGRSTWQIQWPQELNVIFRPVWRFLPFAFKVMFSDAYVVGEKFSKIINWKHKKIFNENSNDIVDTILGKDGFLIITGAASGIGLALTRKLHARGYKMILIDRLPEIEDIARECEAIAIQEDLSDDAVSDRLIERIVSLDLNISGVVHCAGAGWRGEFSSQPNSSIEKLMKVNFIFPVIFTRKLLPLLKNRTASVISFVASSISSVPLPFMAIYGSTKAGLLSFALALRGELAKGGVRVSVILPSGTRTKFQESAGVKVLNEGRGLLSPDVVAERIISAIQNGRVAESIGFAGRILAIITSILPYNLQVRLWSRMMGSWR